MFASCLSCCSCPTFLLFPTFSSSSHVKPHLSHWQQRVPLLGMNHLLVCLKFYSPIFLFFFSISLLYVTLSCETRSQDAAAAGTIGSVPGSSGAVSWCLPGSLLKALANYCSRCHCLPAFSLRSWQCVICPRPQSYWMAGISRSEGEFPSLNDNWLQAACEGFMARIQGELRESWAW